MITATTTYSPTPQDYDDWLTNELIDWVRNVPLESDAVSNIPRIMSEYERRKTFWQKIKLLLS